MDHRGNQLEFIIREFNGRQGVRRSMLQASVFDPVRDHTRTAQQGFPCMQHVSFVPNVHDKSLMLNAFYATQQLFEKGYGNYLGLCRLGSFMAHELGLTFSQLNCFAGVGKIDSVGRPAMSAALQALLDVATEVTSVTGSAAKSVV